jgi:hypothetical protein
MEFLGLFALVILFAYLDRMTLKPRPHNLVREKMLHPRRKLRKKYVDILKHDIKQRLSAEETSNDPYLVMRNAQVGKHDGWKNYLQKEKHLARRLAMKKSLRAAFVRSKCI